MRVGNLAISALLALAMSVAAAPASAQQQQSDQKKPEKKVWTNDDLDALHNKHDLSTFNQPAETSPEATAATPGGESGAAGAAAAAPKDKASDPAWYRDQLGPLQSKLADLDAQIAKLNSFLNGGTRDGGFDLSKDAAAISPQAQLTDLQKQREDVAAQIDDLEDQARKNRIEPGELRATSEPSAPKPQTAAPAAGASPAAGLPSDEAGWRARFAELHKKLDMAQRELDVLQKQFNQNQTQYSPNPNDALLQQYSRRDLDTQRKQIEDKTAQIQDIQQQISDLEDSLRRAGLPAGWARE